MKKKLSQRQRHFLNQFLDVYQETRQPLHYVVIAERLGIGKVTAYEMLRLLEERGLVKAEYQTNPEQHGPGRATVLFYPTQEAKRVINELAGGSADLRDWQATKNHILNQLQQDGRAGGYEDLISNLLARVQERRSPLVFMTEFITAMILALMTLQEAPGLRSLIERLGRIGLPQEVGLNALTGIGLTLSALEHINLHCSTILLAQVGRFEETLSQLNEESKRELSEFTRELVRILSG